MLAKATQRPSAEIEGEVLMRFPCTPAESTLTRVVVWPTAGAASGMASSAQADRSRMDPRTLLVPRLSRSFMLPVLLPLLFPHGQRRQPTRRRPRRAPCVLSLCVLSV